MSQRLDSRTKSDGENLRTGPCWIPDNVVKQNGPPTYLTKVRDNQVWRWHVDTLHHMGDIPRELSTPEHSSIAGHKFTDTSVITILLLKLLVSTEGANTNTTDLVVWGYPQGTRQLLDRLVHQGYLTEEFMNCSATIKFTFLSKERCSVFVITYSLRS